MSKTYNPIARLAEQPLELDGGGGFRSEDAPIGQILQLTRLGCVYTEVAPGDTACPFHVHHAEDELFVILAGKGEYRFGDQTYQVQAGDVLGAPMGGPDYAHQLFNTGSETLKYLVISSRADLDVQQFPDSGRFLVSSRPVEGSARRRFFYKGLEADINDTFDGEISIRAE
ncbi:MAG: cupin domain-containing protein [Paracoccaceae bacterium]